MQSLNDYQSFTNCYPIVFGGCTVKSKIGPRVEVIIARAADRFALKDEISMQLDAHGIVYESSIQPSISWNIDTLVTTHLNKTVKIGLKPLGGSAGVGAQVTATGEQAQTIYCALAQDNYSLDYPDVIKNFNKVNAGFKITETPSSILKRLPRQWQLTCQRIALVLKEFLAINGSGRYVFHRGTHVATKIEQTFTRVNKQLPDTNKFARKDKWNPADIWAIKQGFNLQLASIKSVEELNAYLREMMLSGNLFGISLKMSDQQPHVQLVNQGTAKSSARFGSIALFLPGKTIMSSKSAHLFATKDNKVIDIEMRAEKNLVAWSAEIKGKTARHGKIQYGRIASMLKDITGEDLPSSLSVRERVLKADPKIIDEIYQGASIIASLGMTEDEFYRQLASKDPGWLWSRYLGVKVLTVIHHASAEVKDQIIEAMIAYMASSNELSAPFVKVS